jgi:hypothetical protein
MAYPSLDCLKCFSTRSSAQVAALATAITNPGSPRTPVHRPAEELINVTGNIFTKLDRPIILPMGCSCVAKADSIDINMNPSASYVKISGKIIVTVHKRYDSSTRDHWKRQIPGASRRRGVGQRRLTKPSAGPHRRPPVRPSPGWNHDWVSLPALFAANDTQSSQRA